jgi:hypothetical protein
MAKMIPLFSNSITCFEDLSNELLCEIFEYLNISEIDQTFSALNQRYANLIRHSNLPIKLNFSSILKSTYEKYYNDTVLSYRHRIHSIYLTNPFIFDRLSFSLFPRLQVLILENISEEKLQKIFHESPHLSILMIKLADVLRNANTLYEQILRLPILQYCKISVEKRFSISPFQIFNQQFSVIKQLVINHQCHLNDLVILSSSLPELHRLSCTNLIGLRSEYIDFQPMILNNLTHLSFKVENLSFDHLELFFINLTHQIHIFYFSTNYQVDYFNASRWENLISSKLPKLRLFNLQIKSEETTSTVIPYISINQFMSSFWLTRQWYFRYDYQPTYAALYSIHPYRSIHYELNSCSFEETSPCQISKIFSSVNHLIHRGDISTRTNLLSFPYITDLTIVDYSNRSMHSISTNFDRFISLTKLYKLSIDHRSICVTQLIDLLYFSPQIQILSVHSLSFSKVKLTSIEQTKTFQTISQQNQIRKITLKDCSSPQIIRFFSQLCPRLHQMIIDSNRYGFFPELDLRFFGAPLLCFLNFQGSIHRIQSHIQGRSSVELIGTNLYVWS